MRFVSFDQHQIGVLQGTQIHPVSSLIPDPVRGTRYAMNYIVRHYDALHDALAAAPERFAGIPLESVRLEPPVPWPSHVFAAPSNYQAHLQEMRGTTMGIQTTTGKLTPRDIGFFLKAPGAIAGPHDAITVPNLPGRRFDHECELAVVIGREAKGIRESDADAYIFGYTCLVDVSMRMTETQREERTMRKSYATFCPVGPVLVTRDEIPHPDQLELRLWVNDELRQHANTRDLTVGVPELLAMTSAVLPMEPGDLYATGTPSGVGPIAPGDVVRIAIEHIGEMRLPVAVREW